MHSKRLIQIKTWIQCKNKCSESVVRVLSGTDLSQADSCSSPSGQPDPPPLVLSHRPRELFEVLQQLQHTSDLRRSKPDFVSSFLPAVCLVKSPGVIQKSLFSPSAFGFFVPTPPLFVLCSFNYMWVSSATSVIHFITALSHADRSAEKCQQHITAFLHTRLT